MLTSFVATKFCKEQCSLLVDIQHHKNVFCWQLLTQLSFSILLMMTLERYGISHCHLTRETQVRRNMPYKTTTPSPICAQQRAKLFWTLSIYHLSYNCYVWFLETCQLFT